MATNNQTAADQQNRVDQADAFEPENMDQTDFIDNSTLSFAEKEVFPENTGRLSEAGERGGGTGSGGDRSGSGEDGGSDDRRGGVEGKSGSGADGGSGSSGPGTKGPITKPMILVFIGLIVMIIVLMILLLVANGRSTPQENQPLPDVDATQSLLKNIDDQIMVVDQLNNDFVIPQTNPISLPQF